MEQFIERFEWDQARYNTKQLPRELASQMTQVGQQPSSPGGLFLMSPLIVRHRD